MLEFAYRNAIHRLRCRVSVIRLGIISANQKIDHLEGKIDYYQIRLRELNNESKIKQA